VGLGSKASSGAQLAVPRSALDAEARAPDTEEAREPPAKKPRGRVRSKPKEEKPAPAKKAAAAKAEAQSVEAAVETRGKGGEAEGQAGLPPGQPPSNGLGAKARAPDAEADVAAPELPAARLTLARSCRRKEEKPAPAKKAAAAEGKEAAAEAAVEARGEGGEAGGQAELPPGQPLDSGLDAADRSL
jgi:hypothetical protein